MADITLFKKYVDLNINGVREFNRLVSSKITQLRNPRTKQIFEYFHKSILPGIDSIEPKVFKTIIKTLSQVYRDKQIDADDAIKQINSAIRGGSPVAKKVKSHTPHPSVQTDIPERYSPEKPDSPSHKIIAEKKKVMKKKCLKPKQPAHLSISRGKGQSPI